MRSPRLRTARHRAGVALVFGLVVSAAPLFGQAGAAAVANPRPPVSFTAEQDHQNMMDQLGIRTLRRGPSGNENAPDRANYDELLANPYRSLPDVLTMHSGQKVTTARQWWERRRPEIVEDFERDVYGRIPQQVPRVHWTVVRTGSDTVGDYPVTVRQLIGNVDNTAYPLIQVHITMTLVTPVHAWQRVPVLIMFGPSPFPRTQPSPQELAQVNAALKSMLVQHDPSLQPVFARDASFQPIPPSPFSPDQRNADGDPPSTEELIAAGWGFAALDPTSVQADNGAGLTRGIIGLVNHGQPRGPDDWGALRAWAWGASRGLDYLETDPAVDYHHVGIEGVSRYGKAALVTMAFDQRFAMALVGSSGKGGATLLRRNWGEALESLTTGEYYWMAGNFMKYGASEAATGSRTPGDLPVDSHELIALCAPRLTFISYGIPEKGDAKWLDHQGSFMATVAASPVFRLLGARGLGVSGSWSSATMPPVNHGLLHGHLAWRQHDGGHTDAPNMRYFIAWVDRMIQYQYPQGRVAP